MVFTTEPVDRCQWQVEGDDWPRDCPCGHNDIDDGYILCQAVSRKGDEWKAALRLADWVEAVGGQWNTWYHSSCDGVTPEAMESMPVYKCQKCTSNAADAPPGEGTEEVG
jgi:hypothetical protein